MKAFAGVGAFVVMAPHLPQIARPEERAKSSEGPDYIGSEPLVIVLHEDELLAFEGEEELAIKDATLVNELSSRVKGRMVH